MSYASDIVATSLKPDTAKELLDTKKQATKQVDTLSIKAQAQKAEIENSSFKIKVVGEIYNHNPIELEINNQVELIDVLAMAGGATPNADLSDIYIFRKEKNKNGELRIKRHKLKLRRGPLKLWNTSREPVYFQSNDILWVEPKRRSIFQRVLAVSQLVQSFANAIVIPVLAFTND